MKTHLQLILETKIVDWHLFQNHIIIKVYRFEEETFLLPTCLTHRIYDLEYKRHRFAFEFEHFGNFKKAITYKLSFTIAPFTTKSRTTSKMTKELIKHMKFQLGIKMHYDPYHIISKTKRLQENFCSYDHQGDKLLYKISSKYTWDQVK